MQILKVSSRIYLDADKLDAAIMFYEHLFNEECGLRFTYPKLGLEIGRVGSVLLIAGSTDDLTKVRLVDMTFLVDSIDEFQKQLISKGATILEGPIEVPTGWNMHVRHPDGTIVEYVEHNR